MTILPCISVPRSQCSQAVLCVYFFRYEDEKKIRKQHPWLVENIGSMSDGAINYLSTSPLVFDVVNPYVQAKCTSEAGEGKDACDADNGRAQSTLQREKNSEQGDLCDAARHAETLDRDRAPGTVNSQMEKTGSGKSMTDKNKADTNAIPDVRTYHCYTCKNELRAYEFFSRRLSEEARRVVGYGKGHVITKDELEKKHQLEAHRVSLHGGGMSVAWAQPSALPSGQEPGYNPVGHLSRNQKSQAKKDHAIKKLKKLEDKERVKEEHGAYISSLRPNTRYCCSDCDASFRRVKDFENHKQNNCGLFAKKKARRLTHDETTVTSLVEAHDDDVGLQAVLDEERGLDLIELKLPRGMEPGWTLDVDRDIAEGEIPVPPQFEHMAWSIPCARSELKVHSTVRVSAIHFPVDGPTDFGLGWESAFYYAKVRSTSASLVALLEYEPVDGNLDEPQGAHHCDFRNLEVGSPVSIDHETKWPAVVKGVGSLSAAARALVYSGCKIVSVNGEETLTLSAVRTKLQEKCRLNQGMKIILRRPVPTPLNRGCARVAQSKKNPYKWDEDVMGLMDNLVKDPALARRGHAVLRELKKMYGTKLNEAGLPKVPPLRFVEKRMLLLWKKNKKKELQAEHNEAVGLFDEGEDNNGSSDDDDMDGDDGPVDYEALKQKHFHDLSGVSVTLLRNRIREFMHDPAVSARDLPAGTPSSGQARSTAVRDHLRNKLAGILAGLGSL